jgi:hypothetical protein
MMKILLALLLSAPSFATIKITDHAPVATALERKGWDTDFFNPDSVEYKKLAKEDRLRIKVMAGDVEIHHLSFQFFKGGKPHVLLNSSDEITVKGCRDGQKFQVTNLLDQSLFRIVNYKFQSYELIFKAKCGHENIVRFENRSYGHQFFQVFAMAQKAIKKFKDIDRLKFWNKTVEIVYPSNGNFYDFKRVHVHKGWTWDIVAHEIGHAIFHMADVGKFGVGEHWIDRCYADSLALSEGWASFFAAWVNIELDDANASFPYMVPRRAPLGVEHVPYDVCTGTGNEWRAFAFLWDVIDTNDDGEQALVDFPKLWDLMQKGNHQSVGTIKDALENYGVDPIQLNLAWDKSILGR